jgi:translation elongation factor EF-G
LRDENKVLKDRPQIVNNCTINGNINNINMIIDFGEEKIEDILKKKPDLFKDTIRNHLNDFIHTLTKEIHCNPVEFPEYLNAYITKYNSQFAMVYKEGRFQRKLKEELLTELIENINDMVERYIQDNEYSDKIYDRFDEYYNSIIDGGEKRKNLDTKIVGLLLDCGETLQMEQVSKRKLHEYVDLIKNPQAKHEC